MAKKRKRSSKLVDANPTTTTVGFNGYGYMAVDTVHRDQSRQIKTTITLGNDLDYAYNLQLQEALNASLFNHSSATSSSQSRNAVILLDSEDEDDYRRRRLTGDDYHKTHSHSATASSASSSKSSPFSVTIQELPLLNKEFFRVYCQGLKSEVMAGGVVVAGIGLAICDMKDNLIFEISKCIDFDVEEGESKIVLKAIVEGLNAALDLGLKNLSFYFSNLVANEFINGRNIPSHSEFPTLIGELNTLQKEFIYCQPLHVAHNSLKFANELAKNAIASEIKLNSLDDKGKMSLETCQICYEDVSEDKMFSIAGCLHRYCFSCMKQHSEAKLLAGMGVKCPHEKCTSELSVDACEKFLDAKLLEILRQRKKEASIAVTDKVYCPYPRCSELMSKKEVLSYTNASYAHAKATGARKCMKCQHYFCINCKVPWHYNLTCDTYKASNAHRQAESGLLDSLARKKKWRQCVKCSNLVELAHGCYHITCRCGYEFCYICGAQWINKKPTCRCLIWDERNIIRNMRRQ